MVYYAFVDNLKSIRKDNAGKLILVYVDINPVKGKFNLLNVGVALIKKAVNWFTQQIKWLVSIWGQHEHLIG